MVITPNMIIAGAPKCGTTSLFCYLADHPSICSSSEKETYYMMDKGYPLYNEALNIYKSGLEGYLNYFKDYNPLKHKILLEATPDYLYQRTPLDIIPTFDERPVIIFILREPAARIYSLFRFAQNNMGIIDKKTSFRSFLADIREDRIDKNRTILINAIENSKYINYLENWFNQFGQENCLVFQFEEFRKTPDKVVRRICTVVGLDQEYYDFYDFNVRNQTQVIRSQKLQKLRRKYNNFKERFPVLDILRPVYRAINTKKMAASPISNDDIQVLNKLKKEFEQSNSELNKLTNIDLSYWN